MNKIKIGCPIDYTDNEDIERTGLFLREPEIKELEKRLKEINKITDLKQQCKKQKDNWNKLKEYMIKEQARIVIENTDEDEFIYTDLLNKMQELEQGSDSNE